MRLHGEVVLNRARERGRLELAPKKAAVDVAASDSGTERSDLLRFVRKKAKRKGSQRRRKKKPEVEALLAD